MSSSSIVGQSIPSWLPGRWAGCNSRHQKKRGTFEKAEKRSNHVRPSGTRIERISDFLCLPSFSSLHSLSFRLCISCCSLLLASPAAVLPSSISPIVVDFFCKFSSNSALTASVRSPKKLPSAQAIRPLLRRTTCSVFSVFAIQCN